VKVAAILVSLRQYIHRTVPSAIGYGMTETSGLVSVMVKGAKKYESVGGPIPNTEIKVVDLETGSSLAARQTGEICMRGPQVRGKYLRFS
jgi:long-chain acyl-CoA synthetase